MAKRTEKCKGCKKKLYKYSNECNLDVEICYHCGKFKCTSVVNNEKILEFLVNTPHILSYLIKMSYLKPIN